MMERSKAKRIFIAAAVLIVIVTATLAIIFPYSTDPEAMVVWYKRVPGFAAMLGFFGCLVMVPLVKTVAKKLLQRPEEYYSSYEARLAALSGPAPGKSLADPSAPSESSEEPVTETIQQEPQASAASTTKGGSHG